MGSSMITCATRPTPFFVPAPRYLLNHIKRQPPCIVSTLHPSALEDSWTTPIFILSYESIAAHRFLRNVNAD